MQIQLFVCVCSLFYGVTWILWPYMGIVTSHKSHGRNARFWLVERNFAALWLVRTYSSLYDYYCQLNSIDLWQNNLTDEGVKYLAEALKHNSCKLKSLNLTNNKLTEEGVKYLAEALKDGNCKLHGLDLACNKLSDEGVKYVADTLKDSHQGHPTAVFCKISVRRSKYLEYWGRLQMSRWLLHWCTSFEAYLINSLPFPYHAV